METHELGLFWRSFSGRFPYFDCRKSSTLSETPW